MTTIHFTFICSSLLTLITNIGPAIDKSETTIAQMLKDQGYATNMIGKWHLGFDIPKGGRCNKLTGRLTGGPLDRGFDNFYGNDKSGPSSNPLIGRTKVAEAIDESRQNRIFCHDAVRIIKEHAASDQSQPLFLYYALLEPHNPQVPEAEFHGKSEAGAYGDYVVQLDHWLGQVLDVLNETGLEKNTLLIFASDNGASKRNLAKCPGHAGNGVLSGYKAMPLEGGHRVPMIVRWPGHVAASSNSAALINHTDFFATFAEMLNVELSSYPDSAKDSHSFLSVLNDSTATHNRPPMPVVGSYLKANWKLIIDDYKASTKRVNSVALYDLSDDLSEKSNLLKTQPAKAAALLAEYRQYLANREIKESSNGRKLK